jgi:hypothetical protein
MRRDTKMIENPAVMADEELVERIQEIDAQLPMVFDYAEVNGFLPTLELELSCVALVEACEMECELRSRRGYEA